MRFLLHLLIDPIFHWIILISIGIILYQRNKRKLAWRWLLVATIWLLLIGMTPLSTWLAYRLEYKYSVLFDPSTYKDSPRPVQIMVLGGGMIIDPGLTPADQLSPDALNRIVEGVRLFYQVPGARLVTSGYSRNGIRSQADILASTAVGLGVNPVDTLWLPDPTTTREEAAAYRARFGDSTQIILVTSAIHIPRAMGWFQYQGFNPVPAPANHMVKISPDRWTYDWWPSYRKITLMGKVFHEYAGLAELAWVSRD